MLELSKNSCIEDSIKTAFTERIRKLNLFDTQCLIADLTESDGNFESLSKIIENHILSNKYEITDIVLTPFAIKYQLSDLAQYIKEKKFPNYFYIAQLYRANLLSKDVENLLANELYKIYKDNSSFTRREIIESFQERGTAKLLPLLEVIQFELEPYFKSQKVIVDSFKNIPKEDVDGELVFKLMIFGSLKGFYDDLIVAINLIRQRPEVEIHVESELVLSSGLENVTNNTDIGRVTQYIERAKYYLATDPEASLNNMRKAIERICFSLFDIEENYSSGKRQSKNFKNFETLFQELKKMIDLPSHIILCIEGIQVGGNYGSHDQIDFDLDITKKIAESTFSQLVILKDWYENRIAFLRTSHN